MATPDWIKKTESNRANFFSNEESVPSSVSNYRKRRDFLSKEGLIKNKDSSSISGLFKPNERQKEYEDKYFSNPYSSEKNPFLNAISKPGVFIAKGINRSIAKGINRFTPPQAVGPTISGLFKPDERQKEYEDKYLSNPYSSEKNPFLNAISKPGVSISRGINRFIVPPWRGSADSLAESYEISRKGGITDQIESGFLPPERLKLYKSLDKTTSQVIGEAAQAVLSVYMPSSLGGNLKTRIISGRSKEASAKILSNPLLKTLLTPMFKNASGPNAASKMVIASNSFEQGVYGSLFGAGQALSEQKGGTEALKTIALNAGIGALFGAVLSGVIVVPSEVRKKIEQLDAMGYLNKLKAFEKTKGINVESTSYSNKIDIRTPNQRRDAYFKSQGYEPLTPSNELPVIAFGNKNKSKPKQDNLPEIDMGDGKPLPKTETPKKIYESENFTFEPVKDESRFEKQVKTDKVKDIENVKTDKIKDIENVKTDKIKDIENVKTDKIKDIETTSSKTTVKKVKMDDIYRPKKFTKQVNREQEAIVLSKGIEEIEDIAFGRKPSTDNVPASAHLAVLKNKADEIFEKTGDITLAQKIAYNQDVTSIDAQGLQSAKIANSDNLSDIIRDVEKMNETNIIKRKKINKEKEILNIKKAIKKALEDPQVDRMIIRSAINDLIC